MPVRPVILVLLLTYALVAQGQDQDQNKDEPSAEFLEFLGTWESTDGEWVDPTQFVESEELAQSEIEEKPNE